MSKRIIIDGYNLIKTSSVIAFRGDEDLKTIRDKLTSVLSYYYAIKKIPITIVFDGERGGRDMEDWEAVSSYMEIVYSRLGEKADNVIKRLSDSFGASSIVVTSDRDIIKHAMRNGAAIITSPEFAAKVKVALSSDKGGEMDTEYYNKDEEEDDSYLDRPISTKKRGNPKKLPRAERKRKNRLGRL